jgi:RimJ/RimL family protein N-acetyltransferase
MKLLPIRQDLNHNQEFLVNPDCRDSLGVCIQYYDIVGFNPPWICYYAEKDGIIVGTGAFKGQPTDNKVEIAYGTFEKYQNQGIGTAICKELTMLSLMTDPVITITALTPPERNASTRILEKNGYAFTGVVEDPEDGKVWEWTFKGQNTARG